MALKIQRIRFRWRQPVKYFFFTFSYGENKSNECCASWQVSQIYFGAVPPPPPTQHNIIHLYVHVVHYSEEVFFSCIHFFPFVSGQNNLQTRRNPIHGQSPFCARKRGSKIYSLHLFGRRRRGTSLNRLPRTPPARQTKTIIMLLLLFIIVVHLYNIDPGRNMF